MKDDFKKTGMDADLDAIRKAETPAKQNKLIAAAEKKHGKVEMDDALDEMEASYEG